MTFRVEAFFALEFTMSPGVAILIFILSESSRSIAVGLSFLFELKGVEQLSSQLPLTIVSRVNAAQSQLACVLDFLLMTLAPNREATAAFHSRDENQQLGKITAHGPVR